MSCVSYAVAKIASKANQDRVSVHEDHSSEGLFTLSTFGVYDGHLEEKTASHCSASLQPLISKIFRSLLLLNCKCKGMQEPVSDCFDPFKFVKESDCELSSTEQVDCLLNEAIRIGCKKADDYCKEKFTCGSTAVCIFLLRNTADDSFRLTCANIGDSRCVMLSSEDVVDDLSRSLNGQKDILAVSNNGKSDKDELSTSITSITSRSSSDCSVGNRFNIAYELSEDHKVTLTRERIRIEENIRIAPFLPLPIPVALAPGTFPRLKSLLNYEVATSKVIRYQHSMMEFEFEKSSKIKAASKFLDSLFRQSFEDEKDSETIADLEAEHENIKTSNGQQPHDYSIADNIKLVRENSCIAHRVAPTSGTKGPLALHSRSNTSILMTRSVGDRYGPRCCCAVPDVSTITIPAGKYVRVVLASDGVWDVVSTEDVLKWELKKKYRIPSDFADYLAKKAKKLRMIQELREDDITVVVVDVNSAFLDVMPDEDDGRVAFKSRCCQS